jgi:hypothetical protein
MNFIWIKQVLSIYLDIKKQFLFTFTGFSISWTARQKLKSAGVSVQDPRDTVNSHNGPQVYYS